jgi:putative transport protein
MTPVFHLLQREPFIAIFGVTALGMWLGRRSAGGISLGSVVCILLVGLAASMASYHVTGVSLASSDVLKSIFFNLFIFAMGVKIGPQFFAGLQREGWRLIVVGVVVAVLAPVLAYACSAIAHLPQGATAGLLAGANNSSASFGTAASAMQSDAFRPSPGDTAAMVTGTLAAAFALCYAISEVQYVLFMKWLPAMAGFDAAERAQAFEHGMQALHAAPLPSTQEAADAVDVSVAVRAYRVASAAAAGQTIAAIKRRAPRGAIELIRRGADWVTPADDVALQLGDEVVISAPLAAQVHVRDVLGPELPDAHARTLTSMRTADVVVSKPSAAGLSLPALMANLGPGLYPNAVFRAGEELPTGNETTLARGDVIRMTGTEPRLASLAARVGPVIRADHSSDVLTLSLGLLVGAALGAIPVPLFGVTMTFGAAAVLVTGIVFGWLKTQHPAFGGPISEGARRLMEELGLNVFTAVLALNSGQAVYEVMKSGPVWALAGSCVIVSGVPAAIAWLIGVRMLKLNPALLMGAIAGARQNTASLRIAQQVSRSAVPGIGYPVPLAITTVAMSVASYFFALFL